MSKTQFLLGAGSVIRPADYKGSPFKIDGLEELLNRNEGGAVIITNVQPSLNDIVDPVPSLGDTNVLYVFGQGFTKAIISGILFLGCKEKSSTGIKQLEDAFNEIRVTKSGKAMNVSAPGGLSFKMYMHDLEFGKMDGNFNSIGFTIQGTRAAVPKGSQ